MVLPVCTVKRTQNVAKANVPGLRAAVGGRPGAGLDVGICLSLQQIGRMPFQASATGPGMDFVPLLAVVDLWNLVWSEKRLKPFQFASEHK